MSNYLLRGTAVALAEFVLVYALVWLLVVLGWRLWARDARYIDATGSGRLYALQLSPFLAAVGVVIGFAIPAFARLEPRNTEEGLGYPVVIFATACAALFVAGFWRGVSAILETRTLLQQWKHEAECLNKAGCLPMVKTAENAPPLVVAGLFRPKLYVSAAASESLKPEEFARAVAHEAAHVRRYDNLKRLILRICGVPSRELERRWLAAVEIAADSYAVHSRQEALDLASALVKASRLASSSPALAMTFTADGSDLLRTRVERLLSWEEKEEKTTSRFGLYSAVCIVPVTIAAVVYYPVLLAVVHELGEFLMR